MSESQIKMKCNAQITICKLIGGIKMIGYIQSFIIIALIYCIIYQTYLKKKEKKFILKFSIMYIYLFLVLCVTILPIDFTLDPKWKYHSSINFTYVHIKPFNDLISGYSGALKQVILNIIMTIPFGFLLSSLKKNISITRVIISTFLLSFVIEMFQLIMTVFLLHYRSCDITDLITNVVGGIIGFILYKLVKNSKLK